MRRAFLTLLAVAFLLAAAPEVPAPARAVGVEAVPAPAAADVALPNEKGSLKFTALGDFGTGDTREYELAAQMAKLFTGFKLDLVVLLGDNVLGADGPQDLKNKFETPYKPLLDGNVTFHAALGNHDARTQKNYKAFNMGGKYYDSFKAPHQSVRFFMLDSGYMTPEQSAWLEKELAGSKDDWKIVILHHPIYSSGGRHGSDLTLRKILEPLFVKYNVSVVLAGHDHFYERTKPQHDIVHFVVGSGGRLAAGDIDKRSTITASGFDTDQAFLAVEILGDNLYFNAISRSGLIVDSGIIARRKAL
jgi:predicted phosphodiesterase